MERITGAEQDLPALEGGITLQVTTNCCLNIVQRSRVIYFELCVFGYIILVVVSVSQVGSEADTTIVTLPPRILEKNL